jgi:hypothetical protein
MHKALALWAAGILLVAFSVAAQPADNPQTCEWTEALSGRFYVEPRAAWIDAGLISVVIDQAHWRLEIESKLENGKPVSAICDTRPNKRPEGAGTCLNDRVGPTNVLGSTRKLVLDEFVKANLLPAKRSSNAMPKELYDEGAWRQMVGQALQRRFEGTQEFCQVRLVIRTKRFELALQGDLKWWDEQVIVFPDGGGECCR